jgi:hypothetical protein
MPVKIARSTPRPSFGLRELLVASHISRLASRDAAKSLLSTLVSESSGECRINAVDIKGITHLMLRLRASHYSDHFLAEIHSLTRIRNYLHNGAVTIMKHAECDARREWGRKS